MTCSFQTAFEIVVAIEGLSIWKGDLLNGRRRFAKLEESPIDMARHKALCAEMSEHPGGMAAPARYLLWGLWRWLKRCGRSLLGWLCQFGYFLYRCVAFVLKVSPLATIPFMAFCYLAQWRCVEDRFELAEYVLWFVAAKVVAYVICAIVGSMMAWRAGVSPKIGAGDISNA